MPITYLKGDATVPKASGNVVIPHMCNDVGAWGSGFVLAVSAKWPQPEAEYLSAKTAKALKLGATQFVQVQASGNLIWVANMVSQRSVRTLKEGSLDESPPIRYPALYDCLLEVGKFAEANNASIHAPRFGADRAGGDWRVIEAIIQATLIQRHNRDVSIYEWTPPAQIQTASLSTATVVDALD